ncbi:MAG: hypothetical protein RIR45_1495 [Pseudomonadota bacterium]
MQQVDGALGFGGEGVEPTQGNYIICYYNKLMLTVIETPEFIDWISENPLAGDVIPGAGPLRKVRWTREGMGKRGGARVIYFNRLASGEVVLLLVYAKSKFDNLRSEFLVQLKERFDDQN